MIYIISLSLQGLWMGWLTASGSFARTVGPIYVTQIYDQYGPQVTFISSVAFIFVTIIFYITTFKWFVPFSFKDKPLRSFDGRSIDSSDILQSWGFTLNWKLSYICFIINRLWWTPNWKLSVSSFLNDDQLPTETSRKSVSSFIANGELPTENILISVSSFI